MSSCCGGNCGCGANCGCGNGCKGCKMYPDLVEHGTAATTIIDLGSGTQKGQIEGFEVAEGGSCDCTKCNCGSSCSCSCCGCSN